MANISKIKSISKVFTIKKLGGSRSNARIWLDENGRVVPFGRTYDDFFLLPLELTSQSEVIKLTLSDFSKQGRPFVTVMGDSPFFAKDRDGLILVWGGNWYGQQATNTTDPTSIPALFAHQNVNPLSGLPPSCRSASLWTDSNNKAWTCGRDQNGILGKNTLDQGSSNPVSVLGNRSYKDARAYAYYHMMALDTNGKAWAWGNNQYGQLGDGTVNNRSSPVSVLGNKTFSTLCKDDISYHSMALDTAGKCWCWGVNYKGACGGNTTIYRSSPVSVLGNHTYQKVAASYTTCVGLDSNGVVWAWGEGRDGRLGNNDINDRSQPISVHLDYSNGRYYVDIDHTDGTGYAIDNDGQVWAWGNNSYGNLGIEIDDELLPHTSVPVQVKQQYGLHDIF